MSISIVVPIATLLLLGEKMTRFHESGERIPPTQDQPDQEPCTYEATSGLIESTCQARSRENCPPGTGPLVNLLAMLVVDGRTIQVLISSCF